MILPVQVSFHPLQSFSNALRAVDVASVPLSVVRGWVIWELLEGQRGTGMGGFFRIQGWEHVEHVAPWKRYEKVHKAHINLGVVTCCDNGFL